MSEFLTSLQGNEPPETRPEPSTTPCLRFTTSGQRRNDPDMDPKYRMRLETRTAGSAIRLCCILSFGSPCSRPRGQFAVFRCDHRFLAVFMCLT